MKTQFQDIIKQEGLLRNEPAMMIMEEGNTEHGRLMLTTKRLMFLRNVIDATGFDDYTIREQRLELLVDVDLDLINFITRETHIVDENILSVTYMQYENVKFSVIHYNEWEHDVQTARLNPDIPGDPNRQSEAA
ncbi:MAG: hypothetical protein EOP49_14075 [Sphingobacteriales bacterium]|nr:MAG: hypothetical protein EOP49_14075 [Sphingobacteriales bacterium]